MDPNRKTADQIYSYYSDLIVEANMEHLRNPRSTPGGNGSSDCSCSGCARVDNYRAAREKELQELQNLNQEIPGTRQCPWEVVLEDTLAAATPAEVLIILRKLQGWLCGYCVTCGTYNPNCGERILCDCEYKGDWFNR